MQNCLLEVLLLLTPSGLLTTLVYLYLNAGKPTKHHTGQLFLDVIQNVMKYGEKILLLPQAQRGTSKSSSSFLAAINYCRWAATGAKELYAIWFEVTTCSCWQSVDWCCCNHEYQGSPHLPSISCQTHQCVYTFLDWSNVLQSVVHICITGIVSFSTMQPVSAFLFFYLATDGAASINVSFQVLAKKHLIWFCKLFTNKRGLLFPVQLILGVKSTVFFTSKLFV